MTSICFCCIFSRFQWITYEVFWLIYRTKLFIVDEQLWINCQVVFSMRLMVPRSRFKRCKTSQDSCYQTILANQISSLHSLWSRCPLRRVPNNRLADRLTDWPTDRLTDWSTDRLTDWPIDRPTDRITKNRVKWSKMYKKYKKNINAAIKVKLTKEPLWSVTLYWC